MADEKKPATTKAAETPFERFRRLARRVVNVPKEQADKVESKRKAS